MADNIKIIGNILNTTTVSRYKTEDTNLILSRNLQENFGETGDYIEYFIYDAGGNLLNINYNYLNYKLPPSTGLTPGTSNIPNTTGNIQTTDVGITSTLATQTSSLYPIIEIDPVKDLQNIGYSSGEFNTRYNLFTNILSNSVDKALFVKEISQDRTEVRLASTTLTNDEIEIAVNNVINQINSSSYYVDYILNFGDNQQYVAVNIALNKATTGYEVLSKLYEPLPLEIQEKQTLWIVEEKVFPYVFDINLDKLVIPPPSPTLRGPNFDINLPNQGTIATSYNTYANLVSSLQSLQNSSYQKVLNLLTSQSIDINIDYSDFNNFIFFGSAYQRVNNFYNKAKQIEDYNTLISTYTPLTSSTPSLITETNKLTSDINNIISQFDGYETYLYFESNSYAWPKTNSDKPYSLLPANSVTVTSWYNTLTGSAKEYDADNYDNLEYAIPPFIKEDNTNQPFLTFLNMVGHYFDNIWVYLKAITDINLANNNLEAGISKDLVYERLKSLGLKLYNSQAGESVDQFLIGANTGSSIFDNDFSITGSYINNIPRKDLVSELYKRIYHNLPLLLKTKGTVTGLEHLITTFGLTGSILNVKEFGGGTKAELIKGYNNDKVRIVPNTIEGNVLSPLLSLQSYPTVSANFRDSDLHYIDISFSPETQIDTYISGAIAATNPTWSLDDYIGDPRDQYSITYPSLDDQRKLYFETGVPGFAPFTGSALEYNGFIRLIEYFDNSLFKMLEDFVPERASLSTGITINSPILERNKVSYANPTNTTTQSVYDADYNIANINAQYGQFYEELQGDKKAFYTGELSGSIVDVGQYFEDNYNPYLGDWSVFNSQHPLKENINTNTFLHSDWNVLLNNVSKSIVSNYRQKIEYIWGTTGSILSPVELQDSYLSLRSYNVSRYEGSKVTSLLYNTYTSASNTYAGDDSFGKTAAIDRNSYKFAWVKTIESRSLDFYDKTKIQLKYLIDGNSSVTELNAANKNLFEVQNTFKSGKPTTVSVTDIYKPSNQKKLDGTKTIFKGGFSYSPILFRENYETVTVRFDEPYSSSLEPFEINARNDNWWLYNNNRGIFGIANPKESPNGLGYPDDIGIGQVFENGKENTEETIIETAYPAFDYPYIGNNNANEGVSLVPFFNNSTQSIIGKRVYIIKMNFDNILKNSETTENYISSNNGNYIYKVPRNSEYNISANIPFRITFQYSNVPGNDIREFKIVAILQKTTTPSNEDSWWLSNNLLGTSILIPDVITNVYTSFNGKASSIQINNKNTLGIFAKFAGFASLNLNNTSLGESEYIRIKFLLLDISGIFSDAPWDKVNLGINMVSYTPGISSPPPNARAQWSIKDVLNTKETFFYDKEYRRQYPLFTTGSSNQLIFDGQITEWFTTSSMFVPSFSTSDLYSEVTEPISIEQGDLIRLSEFNKPKDAYYEVIKSEIVALPPQSPASIIGKFEYQSAGYDDGGGRFPIPLFNFIFSYNSDTYPIEFKIGDIFTVSGTDRNNGTFTVYGIENKQITISGTSVNGRVLILSSSPSKWRGDAKEEQLILPATFTFANTLNKLQVTLNSPINLIKYKGDESFAIFKSKPDETSVIVEHQKKDGEVAQTLLIPEDISKEVKDKIGDIVKNINVDLSQ